MSLVRYSVVQDIPNSPLKRLVQAERAIAQDILHPVSPNYGVNMQNLGKQRRLELEANVAELKRRLAVEEAALRGETIEYQSRNYPDRWITASTLEYGFVNLSWDWDRYYFRIKPEPRELFVNIYPGTEISIGNAHITKAAADLYGGKTAGRTLLRFVEDIDFKG